MSEKLLVALFSFSALVPALLLHEIAHGAADEPRPPAGGAHEARHLAHLLHERRAVVSPFFSLCQGA